MVSSSTSTCVSRIGGSRILPLDHPEPFAATLGVMLYPGTGEADKHKAKAFAAQHLAGPIRRLHETGGTLSYGALAQIAMDAGERLDDLDKRWWGGTATGQLLKTLFALANTDEALASWNNAIKVAERVAAQHKVSGSRSALWRGKSEFLSVAHLWAAWCIRKGQFSAEPEVGYDLTTDFEFFLAEAEILRQWGQTWHPKRDKGEPPLPPDAWRTPEDWRPPNRETNWPETGWVRVPTIADELLRDLRPSGRPQKPA